MKGWVLEGKVTSNSEHMRSSIHFPESQINPFNKLATLTHSGDFTFEILNDECPGNPEVLLKMAVTVGRRMK